MTQAQDYVGTMEVADRQRFDVAALEDYLRSRLPDFKGPLRVEQFKGGQSNPTFKLLTAGRSYVMRAKPGPVARLLPSAHAIEREFRVLRALSGTDVPVAENQAAYIAGWLRHIRDGSAADVIRAAADAQRAADFLTGGGGEGSSFSGGVAGRTSLLPVVVSL